MPTTSLAQAISNTTEMAPGHGARGCRVERYIGQHVTGLRTDVTWIFHYLRQELLGEPSGLEDSSDAQLRNLLRRAHLYLRRNAR